MTRRKYANTMYSGLDAFSASLLSAFGECRVQSGLGSLSYSDNVLVRHKCGITQVVEVNVLYDDDDDSAQVPRISTKI